MIQLTRKHIRAIRTTIRQSLGITNARKAPTITFRATLTDLRIQAATDKTAIECRLPGTYQPECFAFAAGGSMGIAQDGIAAYSMGKVRGTWEVAAKKMSRMRKAAGEGAAVDNKFTDEERGEML